MVSGVQKVHLDNSLLMLEVSLPTTPRSCCHAGSWVVPRGCMQLMYSAEDEEHILCIHVSLGLGKALYKYTNEVPLL